MTHYSGRSVRILSLLLLTALGLVGSVQGQDAPAISLPLNETVTGTLDSEETITYTFELPPDQDVVIAYGADAIIYEEYCVRATSRPSELEGCSGRGGGGGGDVPVSRAFLIPTHNQPEIRRTVELDLNRPSLEVPASYTLTAYSVTPQTVDPDQPLEVESDPDLPYQTYILDMDLSQPFAVQIEDAAADGDFLWAANEPYRRTYSHWVDFVEEEQLFPQSVDSAAREDNPAGINALHLDYVGATTFRAWVRAAGDYTLRFTPLDPEPLVENSEALLTSSYRVPLRLVSLATEYGDRPAFTARWVSGSGALFYICDPGAAEGCMVGHVGETGDPDYPFRESDSFQWRGPATGEPMIAIVQIPDNFIRGKVTVGFTWTRTPEAEE